MPYYVQLLLENGADPSKPNANGCIPIIYAVKSDEHDIVKMLLEYHSPTTTMDYKYSAMIQAIEHKNVVMAYLLAQYCVSPLTITNEFNPVDVAIKKKSSEIFKLLLTMGADTQTIRSESLSKDLREIFKKSAVTPDHENPIVQEVRKSFDAINTEYQELKSRVETQCQTVKDTDFKNEFITPALNTINALIYAFVRFIRKIDSIGKLIFREKAEFISIIYNNLFFPEKILIKSKLKDDELNWLRLYQKLRQFAISSPQEMRIGGQFMVEASINNLGAQASEILPESMLITDEIINASPSILCAINFIQRDFFKLVGDVYELYVGTLQTTFYKFVDDSTAALCIFRDTLIEVRQTSYDIIISSNLANDEKVEQVCATQCNKIQADIAYIEWEREQFSKLSSLITRCLRMCMH